MNKIPFALHLANYPSVNFAMQIFSYFFDCNWYSYFFNLLGVTFFSPQKPSWVLVPIYACLLPVW